MSVKDRIEDAECLWKNGRQHGAWTMALIAAAATSRKRYPKPPHPDRESFTRFIRDVGVTIMTGELCEPSKAVGIGLGYPPDRISLEDLMYEQLRCCLVHEAVLGPLVDFTPSIIKDGRWQGDLIVGGRSARNKLPEHFILTLMQAVREAPENAGLFGA